MRPSIHPSAGRATGRTIGLALLTAFAQGCADVRGSDLEPGVTGPMTASTTTGPEDSSDSSSSGAARFDLAMGSTEDGGTGSCVGVSVEAQVEVLPADVIIVVDSSTSMGAENEAVMAGLNAFAASVTDGNIDVRVVLVGAAADGYYGPNWVSFGMCIDAPLGSGECAEAPEPGVAAADSRLPGFLHLDRFVDSSSPLAVGVATYGDWQGVLREDAVGHFVVISDADATQTSISAFTEMFLQPDSETPLIVHGVVPVQPCENAPATATGYIELAEQTGGVIADLCEGDFAEVFDALSDSVVTEAVLPCTWEIPAPPKGWVLDTEEVNVEYTAGLGDDYTIGHVEALADCAQVADGWYYDSPGDPQRILACPQTCGAIGTDPGGRIDIVFGCATLPAG